LQNDKITILLLTFFKDIFFFLFLTNKRFLNSYIKPCHEGASHSNIRTNIYREKVTKVLHVHILILMQDISHVKNFFLFFSYHST